jgi:hypothetical protein
MFQLFQSYVAVSVFMLHVTSVLSGSCICFTRMLQMYVINVSSASDVCCIQVFHIFDVCPESHREHGLDAGAWQARGQLMGCAGVMQTRRAHPHPGSRFSLE